MTASSEPAVGRAFLVNTCPCCGGTHRLEVPGAKAARWAEARRAGTRVQDFWPELSPAQREEFFISGVCDACWPKDPPEDEGDGP